MIDPVTMNARKPLDNEYGNAMLERMNAHHQSLHSWALEHISLAGATAILDIGYGGGQNILNLTQLAPEAKVYGIDYSEASYKKCSELNKCGIENGTVSLSIGSADALPYEHGSFDVVTAFETIYYWPNIEKCFRNICDTLKEGGRFLICNEDSALEGNESLAEALGMTFYSTKDLENLLRQAGFSSVRAYAMENSSWVCAVGEK